MSWSVIRSTWVLIVCALGCGPSLPPVQIPPPDAASLGRLSASLPKACGTWLERNGRPYLRASYAFLLADTEQPGAVVVRAFLSEQFKCGSCPPDANCQPCRPYAMMRPYKGAADDTAFWAVRGTDEGPPDGHCYDVYLQLSPGYPSHAEAEAESFPDEPSRAFFARAEPIAETLCSAQRFAAQRRTPADPCLATIVPGRVVERKGDVALPTSGMLDIVELLRHADELFAQRRWSEARRRYGLVENIEMVMDIELSSPSEAAWPERLPPNEPLVRCYALWRRAQCNLQLGEAQLASNDLWNVLVGMPEWSCTSLPGLSAAAAADIGRAFAAKFSTADEAHSLLSKMQPDDRSKALDALSTLWTAHGRADEAAELRAAFGQ